MLFQGSLGSCEGVRLASKFLALLPLPSALREIGVCGGAVCGVGNGLDAVTASARRRTCAVSAGVAPPYAAKAMILAATAAEGLLAALTLHCDRRASIIDALDAIATTAPTKHAKSIQNGYGHTRTRIPAAASRKAASAGSFLRSTECRVRRRCPSQSGERRELGSTGICVPQPPQKMPTCTRTAHNVHANVQSVLPKWRHSLVKIYSRRKT